MTDPVEGLPESLEVTPLNWPEDARGRKPGDMGFRTPDLPTAQELEEIFPEMVFSDGSPCTPERYAYHPLYGAPVYQPAAGTVYFSRRVPEDLHALFRILDVPCDSKDYAAFAVCAFHPAVERFLVQLKLVSFFALGRMYRLKSHPMPPQQTMSLADAMVEFVKCQAELWLEPGRIFSSKLRGAAGGDGDNDKEDLAFGFQIENAFSGIYRIWSRPWLVGK